MTMNKDVDISVLISPETSILTAIEKMSKTGLAVVLVVDDERKLLGVITDGDIRRYLLKCGDLKASSHIIMNKNPKVAKDTDSKAQLLAKMQAFHILHLPIVNQTGQVIGIETLRSLTEKKCKSNKVVFMAGGLGTRLHPLTLEHPKPLLKIGQKPILEILLENFIAAGFQDFCFSVNYKAGMIKSYFGDGSKWNVRIAYLEERSALGTAGSLNLLPEKPTEPFFVVNADIMTNINFDQILTFHQFNVHHPIATVCVRQYESTIPYGVVNMDEENHGLTSIEEKPTNSYFVNAGIYILNPDVLYYFSNQNQYCDITTLLQTLITHKKYVATFPIREYWLDVGNHESLTQASSDYQKIFVSERML